ncbi:MAG: phosphatase PAP2 family protein [Chitinophagaceae bacterium]|nr:phosphatase PAP2 family protein [Chitinophagaceae bacterium]
MPFLAINFWEKLVLWDKWLFVQINSQWTNPLFDQIMPLWRSPVVWAPLYLFLLVFVLMNFKVKGLWWSLLFICSIALTDMVGNYGFKHGIERIRPCNDPDFYMHVRLLLEHCGVGYSFISNHAANHFGMAVFGFITLRHIIGNWVWIGIAWALSVAYAQVYVGVHYPLDVAGGALLGVIFGVTTGTIFNKRFRFAIFDNQSIPAS